MIATTVVGLPLPHPHVVRRRWWIAAAAAAAGALVAVGVVGVYRYLDNYWLYRGFPPPRDPAFVTSRGTSSRFYVDSAALGGRRQPVDVYLPAGYAQQPLRRYPVLYLLHGFPGRPGAFLQTVRAGVVEDVLLARKRIRPLILVMPFGSTGTFDDKEWANGVLPGQGWETFVARDLVRAVDLRYRTIPRGADRVLAGLSEGGYGALNIGLHHPGEFRVLESWSGYERAADIRSIFGGNRRLLAWNSPLTTLPHDAASLRRAHTYVWLYSGSDDRLRGQNRAFARLLATVDIPHRFYVVRGGHDWAVWRGQAARALLAASRHIANG
jgi:enterochelin esterase-like enzyme